MVVRPLNVFRDAFLQIQIARTPERRFLRGVSPRSGVPVQARIEVVNRPVHG
jgi:hypothetical protein